MYVQERFLHQNQLFLKHIKQQKKKKNSISLIGQHLKFRAMSPLRISEDPFLEKEPKYTS